MVRHAENSDAFFRGWALALLLGGAALPLPSWADSLEDARGDLRTGAYEKAVARAEKELPDTEFSEAWRRIQVEGLISLGRYPEAHTAVTNALAQHRRSLGMCWQAREVLRSAGDPASADQMLDQIGYLVNRWPERFQDAADLVIIGRAALAQGADPKLVLDRLYTPAREENPTLRDVYLAGGELALDKNDFSLAAQWFRDGLRQQPDDPDLLWGLARAYAPSEPALMMESAAAALAINPAHAGSLVLMAGHHITAEDYAGAEKLLDQVLEVNPWHPEAWAYQAVLAHLRNLPEQEADARSNALKYWPTNPRVDYLIGVKLSEKYRFTEGAACQFRALDAEPAYLPAKAQLAQDLLRVGLEETGWQFAEEVQAEDEYDVTANNLMTLRDVIQDYTTLTNDHFVLRMHPQEAALYGPRALNLLTEAHRQLGETYLIRPADSILVEIFKEQKDFAVRTFGMPLNQGFLGVCFGRVITANSPGSRSGVTFNWESMLWHEYCHVVTLQLTRNKMPRWLSEGISVYEERSRNPAWGEQLTPAYREMLLDDELVPVSNLSASFMTPRSGQHLMFAYYQSSLVVEYLVETYGRDCLVGILRDLGEGIDVNTAIEQNAAAMNKVDRDFAEYARRTARSLAPGLDWTKPGRTSLSPGLPPWKGGGLHTGTSVDTDNAEQGEATERDAASTNFYELIHQAEEFLALEHYAEAQPGLKRLIGLFPEFTGPGSAYRLLAETHRALGETEREREILSEFAVRDDEAVDAYQRLMELAMAAKDWETVRENAERYLAVNPLVPLPYRYLAQASESLGQAEAAIDAHRALLHLDPANPAAVHFALARALHQSGDGPGARRHALLALEDAPRFRAALQLLLSVQGGAPGTGAPPSQDGTGSS